MARTDDGATLTRQHRQFQLALRAATVADLLRLWTVFDLRRPDTFREFVALAALLIGLRRRDSVGLAARYFRDFRSVEGVSGTSPPLLADELAEQQINTALYATGFQQTIRALRAGNDIGTASQQGFVAASGAASRLVLNGGRETIIESVRVDSDAQRWQRVTDGEPCFFCAMVASRGAVFTEQTVRFEAHDHCGCVPEPYYSGSMTSERNQQFRELWNETTNGLSGRAAVNAFRAAFEQRT